MQYYSIGKGRKKAVAKFTTLDGLWILVAVSAVTIAFALLWIFGIVSFDVD
jgi:hypothetical protein